MQQDKQELNILLIEDEPEVRESYVDMFAFLELKVDTAENGQQGLELAEKKHYDIIITDLNMPVIDGLETMRRVKSKDPDIEVIVITGFATIENAVGAMKQGAFDYITKPVSLEHVKIVINKCIQKILARRENQSLRDANSQLRELNELKDKFITITNHELRTPLAVLRGYFDLIEMEVESIDNDEMTEYVDIINHTISEMMDMIDNMHDLSGFKKYVSKSDRQLVCVNELVKDVSKEAKILFERRKIDFQLNLGDGDLKTFIDPKMIYKAVRELVQNALKYTDEGGHVSISTGFLENRDKLTISVRDDGIGVPMDKQALIFEPFYEVQDVLHHSTSKTDFMGGGIGVGLSLAREIVASNGGEIVVESRPQKGSIFTIILPIKQE